MDSQIMHKFFLMLSVWVQYFDDFNEIIKNQPIFLNKKTNASTTTLLTWKLYEYCYELRI